MHAGFLSSSLVMSGAYLIVNAFDIVGVTAMCLGLLGGMFSFLYRVSLEQNKEKRTAAAHEILKGLILKFLQTVNNANVPPSRSEKTIH